ncbi:gem-associated protein 6-like isoform X2 [Amphibalanus amphitrite]|nr:gem-associated protein 6-like isoform X2 [Amphibalanus amphitrite]XP_043193016.1 gem-associated protein 6-like isoform X2 [Amphibalanus amphitrite]XP_043193017.1 gem-associated protein 6-like isoform X2 [Amphibalanus amphitrite]XP_043193018.1 gem-associated protein 6-like isoform X2 [Amphibalanus amphitrite]XP_043193019.1 gem-associated protein 6-like isoform X2 [Amphibalanus amphitrite]XP_043193020.1 gem-associated protein 6-like isoform X2 [Amphibalanus amphitrite]XP_043193021.1 gem-asso
MTTVEELDDHPVFKNDPIKLQSMLYREVELTTCDGRVHNGRVLTIDPVSESWVLVSGLEARSPTVELVFGHGVTASRTLSAECDERTRRAMDSLLRTQTVEQSALSPGALRARRDHVVGWLRRHRLPVEVGADHVTVAGVATLHAPYTADQCVCANELVLQRLDALLRAAPPPDGAEHPAGEPPEVS